jgi:hypothetical protein
MIEWLIVTPLLCLFFHYVGVGAGREAERRARLKPPPRRLYPDLPDMRDQRPWVRGTTRRR